MSVCIIARVSELVSVCVIARVSVCVIAVVSVCVVHEGHENL